MDIKTINGLIAVDLDSVTLNEVSNIISELSVDAGVPEGVQTILYSGKISGYSTNDIVKKLDNVRIIDNTFAGQFLADNTNDSQFNKLLKSAIRNDIINGTFDITSIEKGLRPNNLERLSDLLVDANSLTADRLSEAVELASNGYKYEPTKGAWAIVSEQFIRATPNSSEIICLTAEADLTRTWAQVEIPTALDSLPDSQKFGGYTVSELRAIRDSQGIGEVQGILKQQSIDITSDIRMFYDSNGKVIGVDASYLIDGQPINAPNESVFEMTVGNTRSLPSDSYMFSKYTDYNSLTDLQKLQARYGDHIYTSIGVDDLKSLTSNQNLAAHLASVGENPSLLGNVKVELDNNGKIKNVDISGGNIPGDTYPNTMSASEYKEITAIPDEDMRVKYPNYDSCTDMEKFALKAQDNIYNECTDALKRIDVNDADLSDYAKRFNKGVGDLTDADRTMIRASKAVSSADIDIPLALVDDLGKFKKLNKFAKAAPVVGAFFVLVDAGIVVSNVWNAYKNNGIDDAAVVLAEGITTMAVDFAMDVAYGAVSLAFPPAGVILMALDFVSGGAITEFAENLALSVVNFITGRKIGGTGGSDKLEGNTLANTIYGKGGNDTIYGRSDNDILYGEDGDDTVYGNDGNDVIYGDADFDEYFDILDGDNVYVGNDTLDGGEGDDYIYGGDGNDTIIGGSDNDILYGEDGDDTITDDSGDNHIEGGDGIDTIQGGTGIDYVLGGGDNDTISGGAGTDYIEGNGGDDTIKGENDDDELHGGDGNDTIEGGDGIDFIYGDIGGDTLSGNAGTDHIEGGEDNDTILGGTESDELFGNEGNDTIRGEDGDDYLEGGSGINHLYGDDGNDTIVGGDDADHMYGGIENDYLIGGNGSNYMYGEDGDDRMQGGEGDDYIDGGTGIDNMSGGNGYNHMYGRGGIDFIYGGNDNDYIDGGIGDDQLYGGNGNNEIFGREGNDIIYDGDNIGHIEGGDGDDQIRAGGGNDYIDAGKGNDYIQDDHGDDTIVFKAGYGTDIISDAAGNNTIELSGLSFENAVFSKVNGSDLGISFGSDAIIIKQYFDGGAFQNFNINGVMLNDLVNVLHGSDNNDWMSAWNDNGVNMSGDGGNDSLQGGNGADTLDGGIGNDNLYGGNGNDTYIFGIGYGSDTIEDWGGSSTVTFKDINSDAVTISNLYDSTLVLSVNGTEDKLTINGYKWNQGGYTFEFADGAIGSVNKDTWSLELSKPATNTAVPVDGNVALTNSNEPSQTEIIQSNADDSISSNLITETANTVISSISESQPTTNTVAPVDENVALTNSNEPSQTEIIQSNADLLSNIYADDNSISSNLVKETPNTVISSISESKPVTNTTDEISVETDIQVMILTENMSAFATEDNISDSINVLNPTIDTSVMSQMLVSTQVQ